MAEPPRRDTGSQHHIAGRFRQDTPPPIERGRPGERIRRPGPALMVALALGAISAGVTAAFAVYFLLLVRPPEAVGPNAVWLGIEWASEVHTDEAVRTLAAELRGNGIDTIYAYTAWLQEDGQWRETALTNVRAFVDQLKRFYPEARLFAWIGLPADRPSYRLGDETVQTTVAAFCLRAVTEFGFDGIHLNVEPVHSDDDNFPALLRTVRASIGQDVPLSVAVPPDWNTGAPGIPVGPFTAPGLAWSQEFKQSVALLVDEMAVMSYASGLSTQQDYEIWMAFQVTQFVSAVAALDASTQIVMGIPTYDAELPGHDPAAESIPAAINGIRQGLAQIGEDAALVRGVGIYAHWTTDAQEWAVYRQWWLGQAPQ